MQLKTIQDILKNEIADDGVYAVQGKFLKELCSKYPKENEITADKENKQ